MTDQDKASQSTKVVDSSDFTVNLTIQDRKTGRIIKPDLYALFAAELTPGKIVLYSCRNTSANLTVNSTDFLLYLQGLSEFCNKAIHDGILEVKSQM
jgi:hypothetical protein